MSKNSFQRMIYTYAPIMGALAVGLITIVILALVVVEKMM